eukprot:1419347-Karenia_brevis.AAC.1
MLTTGDDASEYGLLASFDGASRGNPGQAATGVCLWWGRWRQGAFESAGLLAQSSKRLGVATNNRAEAMAQAQAISE